MSSREVVLEGGSPWGFRMHGGTDVHQPLRISRVNPGSKSSLKGVREGDLITSINNCPTNEITNSEAHRLLRSAGDRLILGLNEDCRHSPKRRQYKSILHQQRHEEVVQETSKTSTTSTSHMTLITTNSNADSSASSREEMDEDDGAPEKTENKLEPVAQDMSTSLTNVPAQTNNDSPSADTTVQPSSTNPNPKVHLKNCIFGKSNSSLIKQVVSVDEPEIEVKSKRNETPLENGEGRVDVDETPSVSSVTPTPSATPTSSHYSSDTKADTDSMPQHQRVKRNRRRRPKKVQNVETHSEVADVDKLVSAGQETAAPLVKSKSLESVTIGEGSRLANTVQITELKSGDELSDDERIAKLTCKAAIISEAEDEVNWERIETLDVPEVNLNAQEEAQLKYFIEKLGTAETAAKRTEEPDVPRSKVTSNDIRQKRSERKQQMMQFFAPVFDNPRYLDAISEDPTESGDKEAKSSPTDCVIVHIQQVMAKGEAEVVIIDSSSDEESSSSTSGSLVLESSDQHTQVTPTPTPETEDSSEALIKDIFLLNEQPKGTSFQETTSTDIKVENTITFEESNKDISVAIAKVEDKIQQIEENIKNDRKLIDELQISLEEDQKDIKGAQAEVQQNKMFEKEFKQFINANVQQGGKERSQSQSSESSISSRGTTVLLNASFKDMAAIIAEADDVSTQQVKLSPRSLRDFCLQKLIDLPFGKAALEELAEVSESLQGFTKTLHPLAHQMMKLPKTASDEKFLCSDETIHSEFSEKHVQENLEDLQMNDEEVTVINETRDQTCLAENKSTIREEIVTEKTIDISGTRKLLDIIMKEKLVESKIDAKPLRSPEEIQQLNEARLNARDMFEWLQLARGTHMQPKSQPQHPPPPSYTNWDTGMKDANNHALPECRHRRRLSLPPEVHIKQMQYLIEKEKLIQLKLETLESEKRKLFQMIDDEKRVKIRPTSLPPDEELRQRMFEEYQKQLAQREARKHYKVLKISMKDDDRMDTSKRCKEFNEIETEFMEIVKEKKRKVRESAILDLESGGSRESSTEKSDDSTILVLDGDEVCAKKVPKHLHEFLALNANDEGLTQDEGDGIWSPGQKSSFDREELQRESTQLTSQDSIRSDEGGPAAIWTPKSAGTSPVAERREFRPVAFESPVLARKTRTKSDSSAQPDPPWGRSDANGLQLKVEKLPTSQSAPGPGFAGHAEYSSRLPKAQNPTITLLQKAREGQIPAKTSSCIERWNKESPLNSQSDLIYQLRTESISESDSERPKVTRPYKLKQFDGVGPTPSHGMPTGLRSEIRDANMSQWYKRMYDTIHKARPNKYDEDEFVTVRYKQRNRDRYPFTTGYLSEPEAGAYDSDVGLLGSNFATLDRRRSPWTGGSNTNVSNYNSVSCAQFMPINNQSSTLPNSKPCKAASISTLIPFKKDSSPPSGYRRPAAKRPETIETTITYKPETQQSQSAIQHRPGKIENYTPGKSSITEHEAKKWWDEVMDIFDGMEKHQRQPKVPLVQPKGYLSQTLKENGYDSDSTLIFRRKEEIAPQLSPSEQKEVYRSIQKGGEVPLHGLRKSMPDRPNDEVEYLEYMSTLRKSNGQRLHSSERSGNHSRSRSNSSNRDYQQEVFCYPAMQKTSATPETFSMYKRSAPSSTTFISNDKMVKRVIMKPPSPPKRKSSRNNHTLRIIHGNKPARNEQHVERTSTHKRHETCFSPVAKSSYSCQINVREKLPKLSPTRSDSTLKKRGNCSASFQKCYCTKSKPCSKCNDNVDFGKKLPQTLKSSTQINAMKSRTGSFVFSKNDTDNKAKPNLSKIINKNPTSMALKKSCMGESRTSLKSNSMESLKSVRNTKIPLKTTQRKDENAAEIQQKTKKTKVKKDILNTQTKTENKSTSQQLTITNNKNRDNNKLKKTEDPPEGFFQQLFFKRDKPPDAMKRNLFMQPSFDGTKHICDPTLGALKLYLSHTKPVTESKFKYLDVIRSRSSSPKEVVSWKYDESRERSISLPPKLIFTQTSRPATPTLERKSLTLFQPRIEKLYFSQTSRPLSPMIARRDRAITPNSVGSYSSILSSPCPSPSEMLYFSETSRPVSPIIVQQPPPRPISPIHLRPHSPNVIRSPSYRRIKQKKIRTVSSGEGKRRSQKFENLNKFYQDLERLEQLERTTSINDLQPRKKFEEDIIDYDRWQEVRLRERAEREMTSLHRQLKRSQQEHDFLFQSRNVEKWRRELDRGLRIKEKSVENLREEFEQIRKEQLEKERKIKEDSKNNRGLHKTFWRGNSVVNLAHVLNESVRSKSESRVPTVRQRIIDSEKLLTYGVGSRIWSSLSLEQVNILKNQLTQIYGNDDRFKKPVTAVKPQRKPVDHSIQVDPTQSKPPKELRVRRNSDSSDSNANSKVWANIEKSKSSSDVKPEQLLTEEEKKKLSLSLSKEIIDLQLKKSNNVIKAKETRGAHASADAKLKTTRSPVVLERLTTKPSTSSPSVRKDICTSEPSIEESSKTDQKDTQEKRGQSPQKAEKILSKVEYFENKENEIFTPTIYKASEEPVDASLDNHSVSSPLHRSQSNQDLRELYGESNMKRMTSEPLSASRKIKYTKPSSPVLRSTYSRCRSLSPGTQNTSSSTVGDLKDKFELFYYNQKYNLRPRRCISDPELSKYYHDGAKVSELKLKFEYPKIAGRGRSRVRKSGLISSSYLKAEDRYMPHINIISKIASLHPKPPQKKASRSSEDLATILGIPVGEVTKMRERFNAGDKQMSILGHMFTSSPNLNELRDVAQYLTGNWYAHKHPKADHTDMVPKQLIIRPKSTSPIRPKNRLASILKLPTRLRPKRINEPEGPPPPPPPSVENERVDEQLQKFNASAETPRKYVENEVNIHYRMPVRQEVKEIIDEQELARRQADAMRKIYEEERQRKHLQVSHSDNELQDRRSRRHTDNFMPSEKSPIPLNRYDDFIEEISARQKVRPRSPEPRLVARALFNFVGQTARELTFRKSDIIYIRRQIDKNWYEGELNAMVGLFPANYVEIIAYDGGSKSTPRKAHEGQARAKYNFIAQSHLELSLAKGELVVVTRRVDDNWFEGRIGGRKGIFPVSYVEVLIDVQDATTVSLPAKPVASPAAHSMLLNGTSSGKESMGAHNYLPTFPTQDLGMRYRAKPIQITSAGTYGSLKKNPIDQALHIDIQNEPIAALYKYKPQNEDELELLEGDIVQVLEKCDDGWYVGTSERTGAFGTFPGNYVDKMN